MSIDWFTFVAQIVNFLILVALLRKFLYGPILRAMDEREKRVASRLEEARDRETQAEEVKQECREKSEAIDAQREELLNKARTQADEERDRLMKEVRSEVERKREEWGNSLEREQDDILAEVNRLAGDMGIEAAQRVLEQLAGADLETRIFDSFTAHLRDLDADEREKLRERLSEAETVATVRSAFDVTESAEREVREALKAQFDYDRDIVFETDPDLICGLELDADGRTYGWNVRQFLRDFDDEFEQRLQTGQHRMQDTAKAPEAGAAPGAESAHKAAES